MFKTYSSSSSLVITSRWFATSRLASPASVRLVHGHDGISNHQPHDCLLNLLFRCWSKETSKLRITGLCEGNSPVTSEFSAQMAGNTGNVYIWWRHHDYWTVLVNQQWWFERCKKLSCSTVVDLSRIHKGPFDASCSHFPDNIFKCIFLNKNIWILIKISLKFVPKGPINNIPALEIIAWHRPGNKPVA